MSLLRDEDAAKLREIFDERLTGDVTLAHYTQQKSRLVVPGAAQCSSCRDARTLLEELSATSDRITLEVHDFAAELAEAEAIGVGKIPATLIKGEESDGRVRIFGLPSGYEFAALIEGIIDVGNGTTDLAPEVVTALGGLQKDVHIQVFVTPT
ncbi:MAG TPA: thioredoxin family protein [Thermoleophilia bacterium]|nr:thioredoxin family protein [Thermoleophilia bacterium]